MELKDFITQTLTNIIEGVKNGQKIADTHEAKINPKDLYPLNYTSGSTYADIEKERFAQFVDFDIAVTTSEETMGKGGVGIFIGSMGIGGQAKLETTNSLVNRIRFSVPIFLPQH